MSIPEITIIISSYKREKQVIRILGILNDSSNCNHRSKSNYFKEC